MSEENNKLNGFVGLSLYYLMLAKTDSEGLDKDLVEDASGSLIAGLTGEDEYIGIGSPDSCEHGDQYLVTIGEQGVSVVKVKGFGL